MNYSENLKPIASNYVNKSNSKYLLRLHVGSCYGWLAKQGQILPLMFVPTLNNLMIKISNMPIRSMYI